MPAGGAAFQGAPPTLARLSALLYSRIRRQATGNPGAMGCVSFAVYGCPEDEFRKPSGRDPPRS